MNVIEINTLKDLLSQPKKIVVVPHKSPDGDAVGSTTALKGYLDQLGHEINLLTPNDFPKFLKWLPDADQFINVEQQPEKVEQIINAADVIFCLDHNELSRTGELAKYLEKSDALFVMIDHHQQPGDFAKFTYSDTSMSSTCQMVYQFLEMMEATEGITPAMATSMYTGILTDTGSFKFSSTTSTTLRVAAALVDLGADPEMINRRIYDTNTPSRLKLLGTALNNLVVLPEYRTAYITLSQQEQDENNYKKGDTEGFVNYALSIDDIVFAQIFLENEKEGIVKTSLRSKGSFNVNKMAREHWQGGGHNNAAGGKSDDSLEETVTKLISILPAYEKELLATDI